jgi:tetratricopeptide (TPR) repeat protein
MQARRIARERDRANAEAQAKEQIANFLRQLFKVAEPTESRAHTITAHEILDAGVKKIDLTLRDQPSVQAELLSEMGGVYDSLGLYVEAEPLVRRALTLREKTLGPSDEKTLKDVRQLAFLLGNRLGRLEEGAELAAQGFNRAKLTLGEDHDETLRIKNVLATIRRHQARYDEAEALFLEIIARRRSLFGQDHPTTLVALQNLSGLYHDRARYADCARLDAEILEARRRTLGEDHPDTIIEMNNLALCFAGLGRHHEAQATMDRAVRLGEKVWGVEHPQYGVLLHTRGELAIGRGDMASAEADLMRALEIYDRKGEGTQRPVALYELAQVTASLGKREHALGFLERAFDLGYAPAGSASALTEDEHLASLRADPRFKKLEARVAGKSRSGS